MMTDQSIVLSLNLVLWLYLGYRFFSALAKRKVTHGASLQAWGVIFGCYLMAALTVDAIEMRVDGAFGGLPVSTLARTLLMFATVHLYFLGMRRVYTYSSAVQQLFLRLNPFVALLCLGLFVWFAATHRVTNNDAVLMMKGIRDAILVLWLLLILFPAAFNLWLKEQVRPMKLHRVTDLIFFGAFFLQCTSEIAWSLSMYHAPSAAPLFSALERGSTYLCLVLFLVMLLPLRLFMPLFYPMRLLLYWRLQRLERVVRQMSTGRPPLGKLPLRLTHPDELELAIYQKVIAILDRYPSLKDEELQKRIHSVVECRLQFPQIAQQLAAISR